jgi:hypothetical protein
MISLYLLLLIPTAIYIATLNNVYMSFINTKFDIQHKCYINSTKNVYTQCNFISYLYNITINNKTATACVINKLDIYLYESSACHNITNSYTRSLEFQYMPLYYCVICNYNNCDLYGNLTNKYVDCLLSTKITHNNNYDAVITNISGIQNEPFFPFPQYVALFTVIYVVACAVCIYNFYYFIKNNTKKNNIYNRFETSIVIYSLLLHYANMWLLGMFIFSNLSFEYYNDSFDNIVHISFYFWFNILLFDLTQICTQKLSMFTYKNNNLIEFNRLVTLYIYGPLEYIPQIGLALSYIYKNGINFYLIISIFIMSNVLFFRYIHCMYLYITNQIHYVGDTRPRITSADNKSPDIMITFGQKIISINDSNKDLPISPQLGILAGFPEFGFTE